MAQTKTKKDIVKMLLKNRQLDDKSEAELMELLFDEPIAIDVDKMASESETLGDKIADKVTEICGSWAFIITFVIALIAWMGINVYLYNKNGSSFDAYPFILLNLVLSCVAALQAPIIMMSQNRSAKKDTLRGKNDYKTDLKSELILEELHDEMTKIISNQNKILKIINKDENEKS
ncbi:MAG: DUF1003 domain-containing protein [Firmicutes bacterium]|nr:DUF1003 domain-containing protein [Bacillota bacterium]